MTIAITGATGQLGRIVIEKLKNAHSSTDIVALARDPAKAADLRVDIRRADYTQPATLDTALAGIDTLLLISSSEVGQRATQHDNIIHAAKKAGVGHIVYTSLLHADSSPLALASEHVHTEASLRASGIPTTVLRNGWYTENYTGSLAGALAAGGIIGSAGEGRIASATREDYADAAVAVLTSRGHAGKVYELAGDTAWTLADLAAEVSRQTGRELAYSDLPQADYAAALKEIGLPAGLADVLADSDVGASKGGLFDDSRQLSALIGRPTTPLARTVAAALAG